jgi:predicted DNA-binding transcriptional regulator YafY
MAPRPSTSERARRLLALLPHLRDRGTRPLAEIASAVGADESSVAEDLTTLSLCGADERDPMALVAVYVENGAAVVWGELPALERPVRLTPAEARALLAALDAVGVEQGGELATALAAVGDGAFDAEMLARTVRSAAAPGGVAHTHALLETCSSTGRTARIAYTPQGSSHATERLVEPWRLFASRGAWYLQAFSTDAGAERTYRLDRISSVEPGTATFLPPADLPAADAAPDASSLPRAEVVFAYDGPDLGEREWPGTTFDRRDDGTVLASVPFAGTSWIARKVAAWLGDAVVVSPDDVRAAVRDVAAGELAGLGGPVG